MYKRFDQLAHFFTSLPAVMIGLLCLIFFMVFETQTLFFQMLPVEMGAMKRLFASVLVAVVFEFSVLITTANTENLNKRVPGILALCGFVLIVWFWRAWEGTPILVFYKFFASGLQAYLNYIYSDLFMKKWKERNLQDTKASLQQMVDELQRQLTGMQAKQIELTASVKERKQLLNDLTCPHCGMIQQSQNGFNAHVGRCKLKRRIELQTL